MTEAWARPDVSCGEANATGFAMPWSCGGSGDYFTVIPLSPHLPWMSRTFQRRKPTFCHHITVCRRFILHVPAYNSLLVTKKPVGHRYEKTVTWKENTFLGLNPETSVPCVPSSMVQSLLNLESMFLSSFLPTACG